MITWNLLIWCELPTRKMYVTMPYHDLYPAIHRILRECELTGNEEIKRFHYITNLMMNEPDTILYSETGENVPQWLLMHESKTNLIIEQLRKRQIQVAYRN